VDLGWHTRAKLERPKTCTHIREAMLFCCASVCPSWSMNEEALQIVLGCSLFQGQTASSMEKANPEVGKVEHTEKRRERSLGIKGHEK